MEEAPPPNPEVGMDPGEQAGMRALLVTCFCQPTLAATTRLSHALTACPGESLTWEKGGDNEEHLLGMQFPI